MKKWELEQEYVDDSIDNYVEQFPDVLREKGVLACIVMDYYMTRDIKNPHTGNLTYLSSKESFLMSGFYTDEFLNKVYEKEEKEIDRYDNRGNVVAIDIEIEYKIKDIKLDRLISREAETFFNKNSLFAVFNAMTLEKLNHIPHEELLRFNIVDLAINGKTFDERKFYTKQAIDILGMKTTKKETTINLRKRGGEENMNTIGSRPGGGFIGVIDEDELDNE